MDIGETSDEIELISDEFTSSNVFKQIFNCGRQQYPSEVSERIVKVEVCLYCILCVLIGLCAMYLNSQIRDGEIWAIVLTAVVVALAVLVVMSMTTQPKSRKELSFKVSTNTNRFFILNENHFLRYAFIRIFTHLSCLPRR